MEVLCECQFSSIPRTFWCCSRRAPGVVGAGMSIRTLETTQVSMDGWMDKHNVVGSYNGIVFRLKKEGNSDTCNNMNES